MHTPNRFDPEFEQRLSAVLLDVLIRAGLILAVVMLCFQVFAPFLHLMAWALILAVCLYPLQQSVAAKLGGREGLAATLLVLLGIIVVVVPTTALMSSLGDSVRGLVEDVQNNTLVVPPPRESVAEWPVVGPKVHAFWTKAHTDLPALVQSMQPKIGNLAKASPIGPSSERRCMPCGPRPTPIFQPWCRACSRRSATSPRRRWASSPASAVDC